MKPGPAKSFDLVQALTAARDVFWRSGYDGAGLSELEATLGIGRKSIYDTFGNKRALYLRALAQYAETVVARICRGLRDGRRPPLENLARVLTRLGEHHASGESRGCLLGVAMAQVAAADEELCGLLRGYLDELGAAFAACLRAGQADGSIRAALRPDELAAMFVALVQGVALIGRASPANALPPAAVQPLIDSLRAERRR